ncbi:MAG: hypothetical protein H6Q89_5685, partial [Myxococcaceae bacterium]|nr:hypothetical protein [Myxococcaceae bacterium]
ARIADSLLAAEDLALAKPERAAG